MLYAEDMPYLYSSFIVSLICHAESSKALKRHCMGTVWMTINLGPAANRKRIFSYKVGGWYRLTSYKLEYSEKPTTATQWGRRSSTLHQPYNGFLYVFKFVTPKKEKRWFQVCSARKEGEWRLQERNQAPYRRSSTLHKSYKGIMFSSLWRLKGEDMETRSVLPEKTTSVDKSNEF